MESPLKQRLDCTPPVRAVEVGRRSVVGRINVHGRVLPFESTLECDFLRIMAFDQTLEAVYAQPVRLRYVDAEGRPRRYTPDFRVVPKDRAIPPTLFEIKYRKDLWLNWPALKPRFRAAVRYARRTGQRFRLMTDVEIRGPHLENVVFLRQYLDRRPDEGTEVQLLRTLAVLGEATPETLLAAAYWATENRVKALAPLWRLLALRRIEADLFSQLTMQTPIWLSSDGDVP